MRFKFKKTIKLGVFCAECDNELKTDEYKFKKGVFRYYLRCSNCGSFKFMLAKEGKK